MNRASGILLHPTSLPGPHGSGDFGPAAWHFIDWLAAAGQGLWQVLPLNPVGPGWSPYMSPSAFAISPLLVDLADLARRGWLDDAELAAEFDGWAGSAEATDRINYAHVASARMKMLWRAAGRFFGSGGWQNASHDGSPSFTQFCHAQRDWLDDYALFMAIDAREGSVDWQDWSAPLAQRQPAAMAEARLVLRDEIRFWQFIQWNALRKW